MLALSLGSEMTAVLGVVTGFFAGLAGGALLLDRPIRRAANPALAFAVLEAAIGVSAVASAAVLPTVGRAVAAALGPAPAPAVQAATAFLFPALLLLPATAAMGGTLVALERLLAAASVRRAAAAAYAANTAGAMGGALLSVHLLLPALGLSRTVLVLAAVNGCCALMAATVRVRTPACDAPAGPGRWRLAPLLLATGALGIGFEVTVVRLAAQVLENTVFTFAALLAAYLFGTAAGGWAWQRRGGSVPVLLAASALCCLGTAATVPALPLIAPVLSGTGGELAVAVLLFLAPTAATGAVFAALLQAVRDGRGTVGWAVGVNAIGAAVAPPLVALVMIPLLGAWRTIPVLALGYALLAIRGRSRMVALVPGALAAVLLLLPAPNLVRVPHGGTLLAVREGAAATAAAVTDAAGTRFLEVNGHFRMGGTSSLRSDWRQAQIPLLLHPDPRRVLLLGVGTGATLEGAATLPGVSPLGVELLPEVVALLPVFADPAIPRPTVVTADARRFVAAVRTGYDAIVADLFHPALDGTGALYTVEHFRAVRERLEPGGVFCQWLPLYQLDPDSLRTIIRSFLAAFPDGSGWLAHLSLQTPMLALVGHRGPAPEPGSGLGERMARWSAPLHRTGLDGPRDLLGLFVSDAPGLAAFAGPGPVNTDDAPVVQFAARTNVRALAASPSRTLLALLNGVPDGGGAREVAYRRARNRFLAEGAALPDGLDGPALIERASPGLLAALRTSPDFDPAFLPLLAMVETLWRSDREAAARLFRAVEEAAPGRPETLRLFRRLAGR